MLEKGAEFRDVTVNGGSLLIWAARKGHASVVDALLEKGAEFRDVRANGDSLLIWAAKYGHTDTVKALLKKDADVNEKGWGNYTALHYAAQDGHKDIVNALIEKGAAANAKNSFCKTALCYAAENGHTDIVNALIEKGADVSLSDITYDQTGLLKLAYIRQHPIATIATIHLSTTAISYVCEVRVPIISNLNSFVFAALYAVSKGIDKLFEVVTQGVGK